MCERKSMKKLWSDLPNAHHIDWVLASLKENPWRWRAAEVAVYAAGVAVYAAWAAARDKALVAVRHAAWAAARDKTWLAVGDAARVAAWDEAWAAGPAALALIAYDDCDQYLDMGYEKLRVYAILSEKPQAVLLLPMAYVREKINEKVLV
jgi:hypothetical protein